MAEKRMFTQKIIDSDAFLDMPLSTQALYFHLNMRADDDGFVNNPKRIQRTVGASEDDLKLLIAKRFLLCFENGVIVIKHWRMHNTLRKDRYNPTQYQEQFALLDIKDNNAYTEKKPDVDCMATDWQPLGNQTATQRSIEEISIVEKREEKGRKEEKARQIADLFNSLCPSFSEVVIVSDSMKEDIAESLTKYTEEQFKAVFEKAEKSRFLKGLIKDKNGQSWKASFDWLIKAENIAKVLNGNFDDAKDESNSNGASYDLEKFRRDSIEKPIVYAKDNPDVQARADALKQQLAEGQKG